MATPLSHSPTTRAASAVKRKYQRLRSKPSPLNDQVRCKLLGKLKSVSCYNGPVSEAGPNEDCGKTSQG